MEARSKQITGQLFLVFARLEQSKQGVVLIMVREKHNLPQERKDLSPTKHPDGYHQTIGGNGSRRRACRTTIRLFGGREARWDAFHHQCRDLAGLLPRTVMCRPLSTPCKNNFTNRYNSVSSYFTNRTCVQRNRPNAVLFVDDLSLGQLFYISQSMPRINTGIDTDTHAIVLEAEHIHNSSRTAIIRLGRIQLW
jgi:hypothetical protein